MMSNRFVHSYESGEHTFIFASTLDQGHNLLRETGRMAWIAREAGLPFDFDDARDVSDELRDKFAELDEANKGATK